MSSSEVVFYSRGVSLPGILTIPAGADAQHRVPGIVLSHGMANNRDEAEQHSYLAERLENAGYAVLRFDFRGCGKSGSPRGYMMIGTDWPQDLRCALTYLSIQPQVDPQRLGAAGSSWGGGVTVYVSAKDRRIRSAVSLAGPASGFRQLQSQWVSVHGEAGWQGFLDRVAADNRERACGRPSQTARLIGGIIPVAADQVAANDKFLAEHPAIVVDIPYEVADDILCFAPEEVVDRVSPTPLLIIHGTADALVDLKEPRAYYASAREPKELMLVEGGIHQLLSGDTAQPVADAILRWFSKTL